MEGISSVAAPPASGGANTRDVKARFVAKAKQMSLATQSLRARDRRQEKKRAAAALKAGIAADQSSGETVETLTPAAW